MVSRCRARSRRARSTSRSTNARWCCPRPSRRRSSLTRRGQTKSGHRLPRRSSPRVADRRPLVIRQSLAPTLLDLAPAAIELAVGVEHLATERLEPAVEVGQGCCLDFDLLPDAFGQRLGFLEQAIGLDHLLLGGVHEALGYPQPKVLEVVDGVVLRWWWCAPVLCDVGHGLASFFCLARSAGPG